MAGFNTIGGVAPSGAVSGDTSVAVYFLKNSKEETLHTYSVPKDQQDAFEKSFSADIQSLSQSYHDSVHLVKAERIF